MTRQETFAERAARLAAAAGPAVENCLVYRNLDSTQACALRLIEQVEEEEIALPPTVIIAEHQERGRGRAERSWESPFGGLYLSWVASGLDRGLIARLPMIAAAAAARTMLEIGLDRVGIKWPNDLLIDGCKLAGLLVHARHGAITWAAVGLGVNLKSTPAVPPGGLTEATSVTAHLPLDENTAWTERLVGIYTKQLAAGVAEPDATLELWRSRLVHRPGDKMTVRLGNGVGIRGAFTGLTEEGHLRLDVNGVEQIISTGDVVEWTS